MGVPRYDVLDSQAAISTCSLVSRAAPPSERATGAKDGHARWATAALMSASNGAMSPPMNVPASHVPVNARVERGSAQFLALVR